MSDEQSQQDEPKRDVAVKQTPRQYVTVHDAIPILDSNRFEHMQRIASVMARASLIPAHLMQQTYDGTVANCFLIVNQAVRWDMDPFALAQSCFVLHGKLGFEGKVIAAMIEAKIGASLDYEWEGTPGTDAFKITVTGPRPTDGKIVSIEGSVGDWKTFEKSGAVKGNWTGLASRNQLAYRGAREWARLFAPALMLGVYTPDDLEEMHAEHRMRDITPESPPDPDADTSGKRRGRPKKEPEAANRYQETEDQTITGRSDGGADIKTKHTNIAGTDETDQLTEEAKAADAEKAAKAKLEEAEARRRAGKEEAAAKAKAEDDAGKAEMEEKRKAEEAKRKADEEEKRKLKEKADGDKAAKDADKKNTKQADPESKPRTIGDICPGFSEAKPEIQNLLMAMHDDMNKIKVNDPELLRPIWRQHTHAGEAQKPYPPVADKLFEAFKVYHVNRVKSLPKGEPEETSDDDGFDGPPSPDDDNQVFDLNEFIKDMRGVLEECKSSEELMESLNAMTEAPRRAGIISEADYENKIRPIALELMAKFG